MQAVALMKTLDSARLCAECTQAHRSVPGLWLSDPLRWGSYLSEDSGCARAGYSELNFVSAHSAGGRTTKAGGNLHKRADNVPLSRGKKRLGKAEARLRPEKAGKQSCGEGKGTMKGLWRVFETDTMLDG